MKKKHTCEWTLKNNKHQYNTNIYWICSSCGDIASHEPNKPWLLLGGLDKSWSPFFDIALNQKLTDMNIFNYYELCKKEKPCNCNVCLCIWTKDTLINM